MKRLHVDFADIEGWQVLVIIMFIQSGLMQSHSKEPQQLQLLVHYKGFSLALGYLKSWCQIMGPSFSTDLFRLVS